MAQPRPRRAELVGARHTPQVFAPDYRLVPPLLAEKAHVRVGSGSGDPAGGGGEGRGGRGESEEARRRRRTYEKVGRWRGGRGS
jgi:hypothetical protein